MPSDNGGELSMTARIANTGTAVSVQKSNLYNMKIFIGEPHTEQPVGTHHLADFRNMAFEIVVHIEDEAINIWIEDGYSGGHC